MVTRALLGLRLWLSLGVLAACYKPLPPNGALLCSMDGQCPLGYHCAGDGTCWRTGEGPDGTGADAGIDAVPFTQPPPLISPRNGASTGSVRAALSRRPLFRWRPLPEATTYEIQVDDSCLPADFRSCDFPSPEASETASAPSLRLSAGLAVSTTAPPGRRYYWRVRGCGASQCTPWSEVRYLDVARNATDFDGDGDTDLVVGNASAALSGVAAVGQANVFFSTGSLFPERTLMPSSAVASTQYGIAAASAGDVDGDGFPDLVMTAHMSDQGGRVYLYRGGTSAPSNTPSLILMNPEGQTGADFGLALVGGDLDGDGHSDLVVGAEVQDGAVASDGKVFIYAGESSTKGVSTTPTRTLENPAHQEQGHFGNALAIGDFNGDGYADLAVAAVNQDAVGRVFIYPGGRSGVAASPAATLDDPVIITNAHFGQALTAGDFDGDGYADLAVGASEEPVNNVVAVGHVYVFHGGPGGIANRAAPWRTLDNPTGQINSRFGLALAAADFNADSADDLAVSSYQDTAAGRVYVYHGAPAGLPAQPSQTLNDPAPVNNNDLFGSRLAVGDRPPGDGFADLFVGAIRGNGTIYVFGGSTSGLPTSTTYIWIGSNVPGGIGPSSLSSAPP